MIVGVGHIPLASIVLVIPMPKCQFKMELYLFELSCAITKAQFVKEIQCINVEFDV